MDTAFLARLWLWLQRRADQFAALPYVSWLAGGGAALLILGFLAILYARSDVTLEEESEKIVFFQIGTGSSNGPYFPVGGSLAAIITRPPGSGRCYPGSLCGVSGLLAVVKSSAGPIANVRAVGARHFDSALVQTPLLRDAFRGAGAFRGEKPFRKLRAIATVYNEAVHLAANRSARISSIADLKGKRVSIGERGSLSERAALDILRAYGVSIRSLSIVREDAAESASMMLEGKLDAFFTVEKPPSKRLSDLADLGTVDIVPITGEEARKLQQDGLYGAQTISGGTYRFNLPVETLTIGTVWICNEDADESLIYAITRALFQSGNREILPRYADIPLPENANRKDIDRKTLSLIEDASAALPISFHPGALRYYGEAILELNGKLEAE